MSLRAHRGLDAGDAAITPSDAPSSSRAGAPIDVLGESDGLKLRVLRPVAAVDPGGMAGMAAAPARGVAARLEDIAPASRLTRSRRRK